MLMWMLIQVHTTSKTLHMQLHYFQAGEYNGRPKSNEGEKSVNRAEGVPAISVIPQSDLRLLQAGCSAGSFAANAGLFYMISKQQGLTIGSALFV